MNTKEDTAALGVLALTFFMIFREGAEIALFLSATVSKTNPLVALEGIVGLALAALPTDCGRST